MAPHGNAPTDARLVTLDGRIIGVMRILAGLLWLANLEWKRPPNFGRDLNNGLYKYVDSAVRLPVFDPFAWIVEHVVLEHYTLFGWYTLLADSTIAALLLLGLFTRFAALWGALTSVTIFLSILHYDKAYEWPWSYYLMFALHLMLFATAAGQYMGLDGARAKGRAALERFMWWLGMVAIVVGVAGLIAARDIGLTARQGARLGWGDGELKLLWFNPLSAFLTVVFGALVIAGPRIHRYAVYVAAGGFAVMALQVLAQWRDVGGKRTGGILGGTTPNFAFWGMLAVGVFVCARQAAKSPDTAVDEPVVVNF